MRKRRRRIAGSYTRRPLTYDRYPHRAFENKGKSRALSPTPPIDLRSLRIRAVLLIPFGLDIAPWHLRLLTQGSGLLFEITVDKMYRHTCRCRLLDIGVTCRR